MTETVQIGNRLVGEGEPCLIIAEAGSNHNRDLGQAKKLIESAAAAGADVVKFQWFKAEFLYTQDNAAFPIIKANEFPRQWAKELADHAADQDIIFTASPFDKEAVDLLCDVGAPFLKWASPEIHDLPLLRYAASKRKPIIISTGMCNLADIHHAVEATRASGNSDVVLLHCVSAYPTEARHINLRMMDSISHAFELPVGLSDHTMSTVIPAAAVARGARVIEKTFTLSRSLPGPDHSYALEPVEFEQMVNAIREVEESLGSSIKQPINGAENLPLNNKSIIASVAIPQGTVITSEMVTVKRSPTGIKPLLLDVVIGRRTSRDMRPDEVINWEDI